MKVSKTCKILGSLFIDLTPVSIVCGCVVIQITKKIEKSPRLMDLIHHRPHTLLRTLENTKKVWNRCCSIYRMSNCKWRLFACKPCCSILRSIRKDQISIHRKLNYKTVTNDVAENMLDHFPPYVIANKKNLVHLKSNFSDTSENGSAEGFD